MREFELEQPIFGANHLKGKVVAENGGNWVGTAKFKLWFYSGGAIEFGQAMMKAGQLGKYVSKKLSHISPSAVLLLLWIRWTCNLLLCCSINVCIFFKIGVFALALSNRAPRPQPPQYTPQGNIFQAPPPAYGLVCGDPNYGWLPYSTFPSAPPGIPRFSKTLYPLPTILLH